MKQEIFNNMFAIFFLYGLSFFLMGWSILIRMPKERNLITQGLKYFAWFGIIHALAEWADMYLAVMAGRLEPTTSLLINLMKVIALGLSFLMLQHGALLMLKLKTRRVLIMPAALWAVCLSGGLIFGALQTGSLVEYQQLLTIADILTRYFIALPAGILAGIGLLSNLKEFQNHYDGNIVLAVKLSAIAYFLYALFGGLFTPSAEFLPALLLNYENFMDWTGLPVQLIRTLIAMALAACSIQMLKIFGYDEVNMDIKTGLYNTNMIYKVLNGHIQKSKGQSVLFIDIDHFKKLNDEYGHLVGDDILVQIADILRKELRSQDFVGRFGGEEFIVILPEQQLAQAAIVADRIRTDIASEQFLVEPRNERISVTVSIGVAEWIQGITVEKLLASADDAMYQAKKDGRNRVVLFEGSNRYTTVASSKLKWNDLWNSGHPVIDKQHRQLLKLGNQLVRMFQENRPPQEVNDQLNELIQHLNSHCIYENNVLSQVAYEHAGRHKTIHDKLIADAANLKRKVDLGEAEAVDLFAFLNDKVVMGHMLEEDVLFYPLTKKTNETTIVSRRWKEREPNNE